MTSKPFPQTHQGPVDVSASQLDEGPHEECGIVGLSGIDDAAQLAFLGLYSLQHRGQESAGICALADGEARLHKGAGLVGDVFSTDVLKGLPGRTAVGHVRYSTAGGSAVVNAQPIVVRYAEGDLAVAHNGNLTNAHDLKKQLVGEGAIFQTTSDSEVIVHLIARSREKTIDGQIVDAFRQVEGAFSIALTVGEVMYAICDPRGYRPLVLGRLEEGHVLASETCALDILGAEFVRNIERGEVLRIEGGALQNLPELATAESAAPCIFELVYFARPDSHLWDISVDGARRGFGRRLAEEHPVEADAVVAVPDSANSAALGYSERSGIPFELGLLRNHYVGRTFIQPSQADRDFGARMKYNPVREVLEGRRIIVVDDSLVRGTTVRSLVKFIRKAGAKEVHFRIASPPVRFPCFYGIDMPSSEELIGSRLSPDEIAAELGVDSLGYLSLDGMLSVVSDNGSFCDACFSGNYAAPLVDLDMGYLPGNHPIEC